MIFITQGDTNSIGLEIFLKSLFLLGKEEVSLLKLFASKNEIIKNLKALNLSFEFKKNYLTILNKRKLLIEPTDESDNTAFDSFQNAINKITPKEVLFTLPMSKGSFYDRHEKKSFMGHTDYFRKNYPEKSPLMFFLRGSEKTCLLTDHIPLMNVPKRITPTFFRKKMESILQIITSHHFLGVKEIYISGINPHAGEGGLLGDEECLLQKEFDFIRDKYPEVEMKFPLPADTIHQHIQSLTRTLVVYNYHDQGLPAFKSRNQLLGINLTLGLPFIRLSVDHGTAPNLYLKNVANPIGCVYALKQAIKYERIINERPDNP
jgi:4-hydroxythreonine-4-phosphate dehydrogenase